MGLTSLTNLIDPHGEGTTSLHVQGNNGQQVDLSGSQMAGLQTGITSINGVDYNQYVIDGYNLYIQTELSVI